MGNLLKILLIFLAIYYALKFVAKFLLSSVSPDKKFKKKEGEVSIHKKYKNPNNLKQDSKGEYVDFEELD